MPPRPSERSSPAYSRSTYCESTRIGSAPCSRRARSAAWIPSSRNDGGSRTSTMAMSGGCSATASRNASPSPATATTSQPFAASSSSRPLDNRTLSSAITTRTGPPERSLCARHLDGERGGAARRAVEADGAVQGGDPPAYPGDPGAVRLVGAAPSVVGDLDGQRVAGALDPEGCPRGGGVLG